MSRLLLSLKNRKIIYPKTINFLQHYPFVDAVTIATFPSSLDLIETVDTERMQVFAAGFNILFILTKVTNTNKMILQMTNLTFPC